MNRWIDGWFGFDEWMDGIKDGWMDRQIDGQIVGQMDGRIDGRIDGQLDGQIYGYINNEWMDGQTGHMDGWTVKSQDSNHNDTNCLFVWPLKSKTVVLESLYFTFLILFTNQ